MGEKVVPQECGYWLTTAFIIVFATLLFRPLKRAFK